MRTRLRTAAFAAAITVLTGILSVGMFWTEVAHAKSTKTFTLDVACDATGSFALNSADLPPNDDELFARSDLAVVNGPIYRGGALEDEVGPSAFGEIGTWRCLFASLGGALPEPMLTGAITYYFALKTGDGAQDSMILVQGLNSHQIGENNVPRMHAVVGGTGKYAGATGEVLEEVIRENNANCFDLRFHFKIHVPKRRDHRDDNDDD